MLNLFVKSPLTNPPSEERIIPDTFVSKILFTNENLRDKRVHIDRKIHFTGVKPITIRGFLNEATIDFAIRKRRGERVAFNDRPLFDNG